MHTNWNINVSSVFHVNFDHVWVEHYPVTIMIITYKSTRVVHPLRVCRYYVSLVMGYGQLSFSLVRGITTTGLIQLELAISLSAHKCIECHLPYLYKLANL